MKVRVATMRTGDWYQSPITYTKIRIFKKINKRHGYTGKIKYEQRDHREGRRRLYTEESRGWTHKR